MKLKDGQDIFVEIGERFNCSTKVRTNEVQIVTDSFTGLTSAQARKVAAMLNKQADKLDKINGKKTKK